MKKFDLTLNLSISLFAVGFSLGFTEFFRAYSDWLNASVILFGDLIFLFVTLYIFSSIVVGIRDFPDQRSLPRFILIALITFISASLLYAYILVIGLVYMFDYIGENLLGGLTPSMLEQMAIGNNTELSMSNFDALEVATALNTGIPIVNEVLAANDHFDAGFMSVGVFIVFASGFVTYAIRATNFSLFDCIEEIYRSTDAAFKGFIRFLPIFALLVGLAAALNLNVDFTGEALITWIGVFVSISLAILISVAVLISLLAKRPLLVTVTELSRLSIGSLGAPSIFLMFPAMLSTMVQTLGIKSYRVQVLLPSALLLCNIGVVLSCIMLLALTIQFSSSSGRSLFDLISPAVVLLDQAQAQPFDLAEMLTQFNKRLELLFGFSSGMFVPLTTALLPIIVILARPLSVLYVMIVAVVVAKSSGDDLEVENLDEMKDEQVIVVDISPIMILGITICTVLSLLIVLAMGYSIAITGILQLE